MEISSETLVSATLKQLQKLFPSAKRYRDYQSQNITRPCFIVEQLFVGVDKQMLRRIRKNPRVKITYLPKADIDNLEKHLRSVGDSLLENFITLKLSETDLVFGRNLEYEIVNGELLFNVEFPLHLVPNETPQPQINNLESNVTTN